MPANQGSQPLLRYRLNVGVLGAFTALAACAVAPARAAYNGSVLYQLTFPPGSDGFSPVFIDEQVAAQGTAIGSASFGASSHALWWDTAGNRVDLHSAVFSSTEVNATNGPQQVGFGDGPTPGFAHALLWNGSAASIVDLHPTRLPGFTVSFAQGTNGAQQVGWASTSNTVPGHAMLWNGTADSAVDLNPATLSDSQAIGTDGIHQVGGGTLAAAGRPGHAIAWAGTAASAVDLNPSGFSSSYALAVNADAVGGAASRGAESHAIVWNLADHSFTDLNPDTLAGITGSVVQAVRGSQQAGYGNGPNIYAHALLWNGTADSVVDLHALLPGDFTASIAYSFDNEGNIYGIANNDSGYFVVKWTVPEPALLSSVAFFAALPRSRRRSSR
jgi:hypothetical protein